MTTREEIQAALDALPLMSVGSHEQTIRTVLQAALSAAPKFGEEKR